jgi:uncharacterized protein (DUF924 family)
LPRTGWQNEILDFWFGELSQEDRFSGEPEIDDKIRQRFGALYEELKSGLDVESVNDADTALAAIIAFDQFPRNIFRRTAAAFATDDLALGVARRALEKGFDAGMDDERRQFLYMPYMHSEVSADQERCVDLFRTLSGDEGLKYAIEHREVIERFGRFPHRNRALGRESTADEMEYLREEGGWGQ